MKKATEMWQKLVPVSSPRFLVRHLQRVITLVYWLCAAWRLCRIFIFPPFLLLFFSLMCSYLLYLEFIPICLVLSLFIFCHYFVQRLMLASGTALLSAKC